MRDGNKYTQKLELDVILSELSNLTILPSTKEIALDIEPSSDLCYLNHALDEVDEALVITIRMGRAPFHIASDYLPLIELAYKGGILNGSELYETVKLFDTVKANQNFLANLQKEGIACEHFRSYVDQMLIIEELYRDLHKSIDETGEVLDDASEKLSSIRHRLRQIDSRIKTKLQEIIAKEGAKLTQPSVSLRNDHYVLPVRAEYKNSFKGTIQDLSASAQTVYIEPQAIIELTTQKTQLQNEEKQEVERILRVLSNQVGVHYETLKENLINLIEIDLIFAKAALAKKQNAERPKLNNEHRFQLINARHPLLKVEKVIPNSVSFGKGHLGIIITGPNTGGKTVLLKTVGLLSLMIKCGLLVPCDANSDLMVFDQVCCDIGDDQSLQNNLSTFSSHMNNIIGILETVTPNSLVLFDEIGAGTDPMEGSNLALAILKHLLNQKICFITTTHYSQLKAFAYQDDRVVNASMEFNQNTLSPTYRLIIGRPGASNAFNIARRLGLPDQIVKEAEQATSISNTEVRNMINKLEQHAQELELERNEIHVEKKKYQRLSVELQQKIVDIEKEKQRILATAQKEAENVLAKINLDAKRIIDELKALKDKAPKLHEVIALQKELADLEPDPIIKKKNVVNREPKVGDQVYLPTYEQYGMIQKDLRKGNWLVKIGNVEMKIKQTDLEVVEQTKQQIEVEPEKGQFTRFVSKNSLSLTLDLRGERYEDAKERLDRYFDDIALSNTKQVTIIHGYGTGALRELVQSYLKKSPLVSSYRYGGAGEGGMGVTVVTFK